MQQALSVHVLRIPGKFPSSDREVVPVRPLRLYAEAVQRTQYGLRERREVKRPFGCSRQQEGVIHIPEIVIYGSPSGNSANDSDSALPHRFLANFLRRILKTADNDGRRIPPEQKNSFISGADAPIEGFLKCEIETGIVCRFVKKQHRTISFFHEIQQRL